MCFECGDEKKGGAKCLSYFLRCFQTFNFFHNFCLLKPCQFKLRCFWCFKLSRACVSVFECRMGLWLGQVLGDTWSLLCWGCGDPEQPTQPYTAGFLGCQLEMDPSCEVFFKAPKSVIFRGAGVEMLWRTLPFLQVRQVISLSIN